MKPDILRHLSTLQEFALSNMLVAFDYNGTLAPIADSPAPVRMREGTRRLLALVAQRYPCVVMSRGALGDVTPRLNGIPRRQMFGRLADLPMVRTLTGIETICLRPQDGSHKGLALQAARQRFGCNTALYVGDDDTDEHAFASANPTELLTIRIGRRRAATHAQFRLDTQDEIDALLQELILARASVARATG